MISRMMKTVQDDVDKLKQKNGEKTVEVLDEKEKIEKAFEAKVIGHPAGNFETKTKTIFGDVEQR